DEAFLSTQLGARRKEIRLVAADLLSRLPNSSYLQTLYQEARQILRYAQQQWTLHLPKRVPSSAKNLGIETKGSRQPGGLALNWLVQLLMRIPLSYWSQASQQVPTRILRSWLALPHGLALVQAAAASLLRHPDEEWTDALIGYWLETNNENLWRQPTAKKVLAQASATTFNDTLLPWLLQYGPLVPEDSLAAYWLSLGAHPWSPQLSRIIIEGFCDLVRERHTQHWDLYHYQRIFQAAAYQSDTSIFSTLRQNWPSGGSGLGRWSVEMEKLLQTLHFRLEMQKALADD
ncbi:MAG: hypothetical protein D6772_03450, partial [Bacteroidetes bacterium]